MYYTLIYCVKLYYARLKNVKMKIIHKSVEKINCYLKSEFNLTVKRENKNNCRYKNDIKFVRPSD